MTTEQRPGPGYRALLTLSLAMAALCQPALAGNNQNRVTLIEMGDLHATMVSHSAVFKDPTSPDTELGRFEQNAGGLARLKTVVDGIRGENPGALLLSVGDLTHGSAEALFTVGDAMIKAMNHFGIDVFTPGNWDFGYGPAVFRNRFTTTAETEGNITPALGPKPPLPPNFNTMKSYVGCAADECTESNGIITADFPTVAVNLYNAAWLPPQFRNQRVFKPYMMFERNGVNVAVIGLTAAIVPQQADVFNIGLEFTHGVEELPGILEEVKGEGADLIVVQSELGLSQNLELARRFKDIDVMYSAHTHEITLGALLADENEVSVVDPTTPLSGRDRSRLAQGAAVVIETNRDLYVGQLDLQVAGGKLVDFSWKPIEVTEETPENVEMKAIVAAIQAPFLNGSAFEEHVFVPGGYAASCGDAGNNCGLRLVDGLDTIVGKTEVVLLRHHVLEDSLNNFLADAIRMETDPVVAGANVNDWTGVDISMANGFRFGNAVLPGENITLRDVYTWFPIGAAVNVADFSGASIAKSLEEVLSAVFHRNPFEQRGGWYVGMANMEQSIDLDNRPLGSSSGRIVETRIGGTKLDPSRRYVFASCYAHGDAIDTVCRTGGGSNHLFFELGDVTDYASTMSLTPPLNSADITITPPGQVKQVAPDAFAHPVHLVRRYLDDLGGVVSGAKYGSVAQGEGRVKTVDSTVYTAGPGPNYQALVPPPLAVPDNTPDETLVQPPFGAGPRFFSGRIGDSDANSH